MRPGKGCSGGEERNSGGNLGAVLSEPLVVPEGRKYRTLGRRTQKSCCLFPPPEKAQFSDRALKDTGARTS